ncbi:MAG: metallophosphoesterase [Patescibacteria group bacterium]|jgi:hypothetical protein
MPSYIFIAIFLVVAQGILLALNLFIYSSAVHFLGMTGPLQKTILGITLGILACSFLASSLLVRWQDVYLTKILYFLAGIWLGILLYLILSLAGAWIISSIWTSAPQLLLGASVFVVALGISTYGIWSSYHPKVQYLDIKLKNLPAVWQGKTIVQISDVHLGNVFGFKSLTKVVDRINAINPEMVVITGDLLDGMGDDLKHSIKPLVDIKAQRGMYFITGNHETFLPQEQVTDVLSQVPIKVMQNQLVDLDGLQIIGINYPTTGQSVDLPQIIKQLNPNPNQATILLYHSPVQVDAVSQTGVVDLMLSGHTHRGQLWPSNLVTYLIYHGFDYGLHQVGKMQIYTTTGTGSWGPTMRVFARPEIVAIRLN